MSTTPTLELHIERPPAPPDHATATFTDPPTTPATPPITTSASTLPATQMRARARRFVQALVEIVDGDRPAVQLMQMSTETVYDDLIDRLESLASLSARGTRVGPLATQVASVHVEQPDRTGAEVSARIVQGDRSRALALRLDLFEGRWRCSAIRWG